MCKRSSSAGRCVCIAIAGVRCVSRSVEPAHRRSARWNFRKKKSNLEHRPGNFQSQTARLRLVNDEFAIFLDHPRLAFVCKFLSLAGVLRNRRNSTFGNTIPKGLSALLRLFWNLKPSVSSQEISSKFIVNHHWSWCDHYHCNHCNHNLVWVNSSNQIVQRDEVSHFKSDNQTVKPTVNDQSDWLVHESSDHL